MEKYLLSKKHCEKIRDYILKNGKNGFLTVNKYYPKNAISIYNIQNKNIKNFPYDSLKFLEKEIQKHFKLENYEYSKLLGIWVAVMNNCYECLIHKDYKENIYNKNSEVTHYCTRLNVLLSKPIIGGEPIIWKNKNIILNQVIEREPWICVAGKYYHSTVKMSGKKERLLLSFGYVVPVEKLKELNYI